MAEFDEQAMGDLEFPEDVDPSKIPTFSQLPLGRLELEVKGWIEDMTPITEKSPVSKKVVKVQFSVVGTPDGKWIGLPHTETFWIGSDLDPMAKSGATWRTNAGRVMKMLKKAKVATSRGIKFRQMMDASVNSRLLGEVKENKKNGRRMLDFLSVAEKPLEYFDVGEATGARPEAVSGATEHPLSPPPVFDNE